MMAGILVLVAVLGAGGYFLFNNMQQVAPATTAEPTPLTQDVQPSEQPTSASTSAETTEATGMAKEFMVESSGLNFAPNNLRVKLGDKVRITYKNTRGTHDLRIDEFNAKTKLINAGQSETIEFTADKKGSFEFYCSVPGHRQGGMKGTLVVE